MTKPKVRADLAAWVADSNRVRCSVCRSPDAVAWFALACEAMSAAGVRVSYSAIAERMAEDTGVRVARETIRGHCRHSPLWADVSKAAGRG